MKGGHVGVDEMHRLFFLAWGQRPKNDTDDDPLSDPRKDFEHRKRFVKWNLLYRFECGFPCQVIVPFDGMSLKCGRQHLSMAGVFIAIEHHERFSPKQRAHYVDSLSADKRSVRNDLLDQCRVAGDENKIRAGQGHAERQTVFYPGFIQESIRLIKPAYSVGQEVGVFDGCHFVPERISRYFRL